jgi:hypothetical protein
MQEPGAEEIQADPERFLDAASALVGLTVRAEDRPLVVENLRVLSSMAALVMQDLSDDDVEVAPVFRA